MVNSSEPRPLVRKEPWWLVDKLGSEVPSQSVIAWSMHRRQPAALSTFVHQSRARWRETHLKGSPRAGKTGASPIPGLLVLAFRMILEPLPSSASRRVARLLSLAL